MRAAAQRTGERTIALVTMLGLSGLLAGLAPVLAHDLWLAPDSYRPAPGGRLGIELLVGSSLTDGEPLLPEPGSVERFALRGPDGRDVRFLTPPTGYPAGIARIGSAGGYVAIYRSRPSRAELSAEKFETYLREEGLEAISALRARRGESGEPGHEVFSRCAKALLRSGAGPTHAFSRPVGLRLELVPEKDPHELTPGESLPVLLLFDGVPLANARVAAVSARGASSSARTERDGRATLPLAASGMWLIKSVHMIEASPESGAAWESLWATLTFALAP